MHITAVMNQLAKEHGVSYIAEYLNCARPSVYSWCSGRRLPAPTFIPKIAKLANLSADALLSEDGIPQALPTISSPVYALEDIANPDKQPIDTIDAPPSLMQQYPAGTFYKVGDTSINKYAPQGSYVLIDHNNCEYSGLVVALHQHKVISGLCHKGTSCVLIAPQTYNDDAQDVVAAVNDVKVLGKVVFYMGVIRE